MSLIKSNLTFENPNVFITQREQFCGRSRSKNQLDPFGFIHVTQKCDLSCRLNAIYIIAQYVEMSQCKMIGSEYAML